MLNLVILNDKKMSDVSNRGEYASDYGLLYLKGVSAIHKEGEEDDWIFTEAYTDPYFLIRSFGERNIRVFVDLDESEFSITEYSDYVRNLIIHLDKEGIGISSITVIPKSMWEKLRDESTQHIEWKLNMSALKNVVCISKKDAEVNLGEFQGINLDTVCIDAEAPDVPDIFNGVKRIGHLEIKIRNEEALRRMLLQFILSSTSVKSCCIQLDLKKIKKLGYAAQEMYATQLRDFMFYRFVYENHVTRAGVSIKNPGMTVEEFLKEDWYNQEPFRNEKDKNFSVEMSMFTETDYNKAPGSKMHVFNDSNSKEYIAQVKNDIDECKKSSLVLVPEFNGLIAVPAFSLWRAAGRFAFGLTDSLMPANGEDEPEDEPEINTKMMAEIFRRKNVISYALPIMAGMEPDRMKDVYAELEYLKKRIKENQ